MYLRCIYTIVIFTFFICKLNSESIKLDKLFYNAEISCRSPKKFDCRDVNQTCIDIKYKCNGISDCPGIEIRLTLKLCNRLYNY